MNRSRFFRYHAPEGGDAGGGAGGAGAPTPPAGGGAPPPPAPPGLNWLPNADADTVGYVQNKGWAGPVDMLTGYRNLETMLGADRAGRTVVLPTGDDPVEWGKVFDRLGRPANPADYQLPVPQGGDAAFATAAATKMHELGVPKGMAQKLTAWFNDQVGASGTAEAAALAQKHAAEEAQLDREWGAERAARTEIARRGVRELGRKAGLNDGEIAEALGAIEGGVGMRGTMKMMALIGEMLGEHGAEGIGMPGSFAMTPEGARARRAQLMADKEFSAKATDPNGAQWAELRKLDAIIAGARG